MVRLADPLPLLGGSGMLKLTVSPAEARTLLAAAKILDRVHDLVEEREGDGHYDLEPSFCGTAYDLRSLVEDGLSLV